MELFRIKIGKKGNTPLLILHGLMGSSDNWRQMAKTFSVHHEVFLPDLRNHGRSLHKYPHSVDAMVQDVIQLMDNEGLADVVLMGHSMGGKVAMALALQHPTRVRKLLIVDITMRRYPQRENQQLLQALLSVPLVDLSSRRALNKAFTAVVPDTIIRNFLLKNLVRNGQGTFVWRPNLELLVKEIPSYLSKVTYTQPFTQSTLLLRGGRSPYVKDSDIAEFARAFPVLQVHMLPTGHWLHFEEPAGFISAVEGFLQDSTQK